MNKLKNDFIIINNRHMPKLRLVIMLALILPFISNAQISVLDREYFPDLYIGVLGGYGMDNYTGTFSTFEGSNECGKFTDGDGSGLLFGIKLEYKLSRRFDLYGSFVYEDRSGDFNSSSITAPVFVNDNLPPMNASLDQNLQVKINFFTFSPLIKYKPFDFDLGILFGPALDFIIKDEITHSENITAPAELYFLNKSKTRTVISGAIDSKNSLLLDLKTGLSLGIPLDENFKVTPEIFYTLPLMKVSSNGDWKISRLQMVLSFSYALNKN